MASIRTPFQSESPILDNTAIRLRATSTADAEVLALIGSATFLETYAGQLPGTAIIAHCLTAHSASAWLSLLQSAENQVWLAEAPNGAPIGYALLAPPDIPGQQTTDLELRRIYVLSRWHGRGTGQTLLKTASRAAAKRGARRILLGVWVNNQLALGFYAAQGFRQIATRRFQIGHMTCDDYVLAKPLADKDVGE